MSFASHILVATDFSDTAKSAVHLAREIAEKFGSQVTVVHVHDASVPVPDESGRRLETGAELAAKLKSRLAKLCKTALPGVSTQAVVIESSSIGPSICELSRSSGVDLIVLGDQGSSGIVRMIMG